MVMNAISRECNINSLSCNVSCNFVILLHLIPKTLLGESTGLNGSEIDFSLTVFLYSINWEEYVEHDFLKENFNIKGAVSRR